MAEAPNPTKPHKSLFNTFQNLGVPPTHHHPNPHRTTKTYMATQQSTEGLLSERERGVRLVNRRLPSSSSPPASDANELPVPRLHRASAVGYHGGPCDNEGFVGGGRPTAGVEDWVGWGPRSGTQSLALRPQQMAAEQGGCRETLIVHAGWLSVREQRGSEERDAEERDTECRTRSGG